MRELYLCSPDPALGAAFVRLATSAGFSVLPQTAEHCRGLREPGDQGLALVVAVPTLQEALARLPAAQEQLELPVLLFAPAEVLERAVQAEFPFDDVLEAGADQAALARRLRFLRRLRTARTSSLRAQRLSESGATIASVCHDLTNPLSCVSANLQALARAISQPGARGEPSELGELLAETRDEVDRTIGIVRELRSSVGHGGPPTLTDLAACATSALTLLRAELGTCSTVECRLVPVPPVLADHRRIVRVILNLLFNARDAVGRRGRIDVRSSQYADGRVVVEVRDDGAGMDAATLARAFEPFFTTKAASTGSGLGLAISRRIVEGYGGQLLAESAPGQGSRFRVLLPPAHQQR